jgi:phosphomannomutase
LQQDGLRVEWAGTLPTPALALRCLSLGAPAIMVTGSHIPFDRNGIKFYTPVGEILKSDEAAISVINIAPLLPAAGLVSSMPEMQALVGKAMQAGELGWAILGYRQRYLGLLPTAALKGLRIGVYQHSAVGRDFLADLLGRLGASVVPLERSDTFVPIDTEAVSVADETRAAAWCQQHQLHAVVSTDGDGDRPWVCDEHGHFMRGDVLGILTAQWLGAQAVVTPVSSNTALEKSGLFSQCVRTRIGSPYVIEAMQTLASQGHKAVVGFEANGGFLVQSAVRDLAPLPTRDSTLPVLAVLALAQEKSLPLSSLPTLLPTRFTHADRIQNLPTAQSQALIAQLRDNAQALQNFVQFTGSQAASTDTTDGLRITLANGDIVHFRPSGNAPELRCYAESATLQQAQQLVQQALSQI